MDNPNTTFILGAGASIDSIPVVKEFAYSWKSHFISQATSYFATAKDDKLLVMAKNMPDLLKGHRSIDTLARKFFIQNDQDSLTNIKICIDFFISYFCINGKKRVVDQSRRNNFLKKDFDKRPLGFLSDLYDIRTQDLMSNIHIMSWNYDVLLELAGLELNSKFSGFNNLYKLNGSCLLFNFLKDEKISVEDLEHTDRLNPYWTKYMSYIGANKNNLLKFAWESKASSLWNQIIHASKNIVVIGYSFPFYNREIDKGLFSNVTEGKTKIFVQDLAPEQIIATIKNILVECKKGEHFIDPMLKNSDQSKLIESYFIPFDLHVS